MEDNTGNKSAVDAQPSSLRALPQLTLERFHAAAKQFAEELSQTPLSDLYGVTDGKAVGNKVESMFKVYLTKRYEFVLGNAATGIDFPSLNLDLKVTSLKQPQSSCPFRNAEQKIYGLGYNLLVMVYNKQDVDSTHAAYLDIEHVIYIDKSCTADFSITKAIRDTVATVSTFSGGTAAVIDDLDALLQDRNIPLDELSRRQLAERLIREVPEQGVLTISNALQWRLQYSRAIAMAADKITPLVEELRG